MYNKRIRVLTLEQIAKMYARERPGWVRPVLKRKGGNQRPYRRNAHLVAEDIAPPHIQRLRKRYCDQFIRTGELDTAMGAELRAYADSVRVSREQRKYAKASDHVPAEQPVGAQGRRIGDRDDRGGDGLQADGASRHP